MGANAVVLRKRQVMTSRRRQQHARRQQRQHGISYGQALRIARGAPQGPGGPSGPAAGGAPAPGWDPRRFTQAENAVLGRVVSFLGDALPMPAVNAIARHLGLSAFGGDIVAARVTLEPGPFHDVSSDVTDSYEYGLEVHEVAVPFSADLEVTVTTSEAAHLLAKGASLLVDDQSDPTLLVRDVSLTLSAQVRVEAEDAEVMEEIYVIL